MNTLKILAVLAIATGSVAIVFGTGAFASINADRLADIGVADDDSGLLGITVEGGTLDPGEEVVLFSVKNQIGTDFDSIDVTVVDSGPFNNVVIQSTPSSLFPGETGDITATIADGPSSSGWIKVTILASSSQGPAVELTREVFVEIDEPAPTLCTIENDDRIGDRSFEAEGELFDCTIRIHTDQQYEVDFETSNATGGFELSAKLLKELEFEESEIAGATDIAISQNMNGDMSFEDMIFGDSVSIDVGQVAKGISLESSSINGDYDVSAWNANGDVEIEESDIGGGVDLEFDGPVSGDISMGESDVGGSYELTIHNHLNSDVTIEDANVAGDLIIVVEENANGDITVKGSDIDGKVKIVVNEQLNGDITVEETSVAGDLTISADIQRAGGSVTLEQNSVPHKASSASCFCGLSSVSKRLY
jgi:hypothetical protein